MPRLMRMATALLVATVVLVIASPAGADPVPGSGPPPGKSLPQGFPAELQPYVAGTPAFAAAPWASACAPGGSSTVPTSLSAAGGPPVNTSAQSGGIDVGMYLNAVTPVQQQLLWWSQTSEQRAAWWELRRLSTFGVKFTTAAKMASITPPAELLGTAPAIAAGNLPQYHPGFCSSELARWATPAANSLGFSWSGSLDTASQQYLRSRQPGTKFTPTELNPCATDGQYCSIAYYVDCTKAKPGDLQSCASWNGFTDEEIFQNSEWVAQHKSTWDKIGSFFTGLGTDIWRSGASIVGGFVGVYEAIKAGIEAAAAFIANPLGEFDKWVNEVKADVISLIKGVLNGYNTASNWDVSSGGFVSRYEKMAALGLVLSAFMFLGAIRRAQDSGDRKQLTGLLKRLGVTVVLILWAPLLFQLLTTTATTASANMVDRWTGGAMGGAADKIIGLAGVTSTIPGGAFMGFVMFILMFFGALGLWVGLMLQRFGMEVGATLIPLVAGVYVHPRFKRKVEKAVWVVIGLILAKPVIMIVLGAAFGVVNEGLSFHGTPLQVLAGLTLAMIGLVVTGLSPFALLKWAPILPTSADSHDHSSGTSMAAGAVIGSAGSSLAMAGARGRSSAGGQAGGVQASRARSDGGGGLGGGQRAEGGALTKAYDNGLVGSGRPQPGSSATSAGVNGPTPTVNGARPAGGAVTRAGASAGAGAATLGLSIAAQSAQAGLAKGRDLGRRHVPQADIAEEDGS